MEHEGPPPVSRPLPVNATPVNDDASRPQFDLVTALQVAGRNIELQLSPERPTFTFGGAVSPEVDVTLDGEGVSRLHAILQRKGLKLRVLDQRSTNGTYFHGRYDPDFEIAAGDVFEVTQRIKLIALDEHLRLLRPRLQWVLGLRAHAQVDQALEDIASNAPLLLVGPAYCEQRALAEEIHRRSSFRRRDFVTAPYRFNTREEQDAKLEHAARGTLYLDLAAADPDEESPPARFISRLFDGEIRPIVVAPTEEHAQKMLGSYALGLRTIRLPPLSARADDIPRLLDALILKMGRGEGEILPIAALGEMNVAGLQAYAWPDNFEDLRRSVPRLHAVLSNGLRLRAAARSLGRAVSTLVEALARINVHVKRAEDEHDDPDENRDEGRAPTDEDCSVTPLDPPST